MTGTVPLLLPDGSIKHWDRADLVDKWSDVGLSGGPTQVSRVGSDGMNGGGNESERISRFMV